MGSQNSGKVQSPTKNGQNIVLKLKFSNAYNQVCEEVHEEPGFEELDVAAIQEGAKRFTFQVICDLDV